MTFWLEEAASTERLDWGPKGPPKSYVRQQARARNAAKKKKPAAASSDAAHPRGTGDQGGQFIRKGGTGGQVKTIQAAVGAKTDGVFGRKTRAAVMAFQKRKGIQVDGVVGRQTALALAGHVKVARTTAPGALTTRLTHHLLRQTRSRTAARAKRQSAAPARRGGGALVAGLWPDD